MNKVRIGVVGAGHLGQIHAKLLSTLDDAELVGVADTNLAAAQAVAHEHGCSPHRNWRELIGRIDAAVLAVPTVLHHRLGLDLLKQGLHLFVEKPLAATSTQALALAQAAQDNHRVLQVGHVERFNPAWQAALPWLENPKYIEASRTSGYTFRSTDIGVALDLMIHDLELILSLSLGPIQEVQALGISIFGGAEDMAQARITFAGGCVANLAASRASYQSRRSMQVYTEQGCVEIDFAAPSARVIQIDERLLRRELDFEQLSSAQREEAKSRLFETYLPVSDLPTRPCNAILEEQREFVASIHTGRSPQVCGQTGSRAVYLAELVLKSIASHRWDGRPGHLIGPLASPMPAIIRPPQWRHDHAGQEADHRKAS